jgi:hypothetical protein
MIDEYGEIVELAYNKLTKNLETLPVKTPDKNQRIFEAFQEFISKI